MNCRALVVSRAPVAGHSKQHALVRSRPPPAVRELMRLCLWRAGRRTDESTSDGMRPTGFVLARVLPPLSRGYCRHAQIIMRGSGVRLIEGTAFSSSNRRFLDAVEHWRRVCTRPDRYCAINRSPVQHHSDGCAPDRLGPFAFFADSAVD
uniref:Uncharacterized protein n=1 Tax=Plectus sambesii TaxID=2011161 RepID=A0A914VH27_9BILA